MSVNQSSTIGAKLRAARERMGLQVAQAADRLHVDTAIIESLEANRFASLGAPVFVRGHLRRYAELLGEPEAPLQAQYAALEESSQSPDLTSTRRILAPQPPSGVRWPLIVTAVVLVLAVVIWWALRVGKA